MTRKGKDCWRRTGDQTVFSLPHIEGITLGAGEEVDEFAAEYGYDR